MTPYKALQSKAFHYGAYIGYAIVGEHQFTTNGQIMVRGAITIEELKPNKDQQERRNDGTPMLDATQFADSLSGDSVDIVDRNSYPMGEVVHLKTRPRKKYPDGVVSDVRSVYWDYVQAKYGNEIEATYLDSTTGNVFFWDEDLKLIAVIAPIKEEHGN